MWPLMAGLLLVGCGGQEIDLEDELKGKGDYELVLVADPQQAERQSTADSGRTAAAADSGRAVADPEAEPAVDAEDEAGISRPAGAMQPAAVIAYDPQGEFTVQVGIFQDARQAGERVRQLSAEGYPAYALANADKKGARVRIGYFRTREEAGRFGELFKKDKGAEYWIDRRSNEKL